MKIVIRPNTSKFESLEELNVFDVESRYAKFGFIIISANRSCEAELGKSSCSEEEIQNQAKINNAQNKVLKADIRSAGFGFLPVFGGYKEKVKSSDGTISLKEVLEPAVIVVAKKIGTNEEAADIKELYQLGLNLCGKFNQDSFLYHPPFPNKKAFYINRQGDTEMEFSGEMKFNDLTKDFFTKMNKNQQRFTFTENLFFLSSPQTLSEAKKRYGEEFYRIEK